MPPSKILVLLLLFSLSSLLDTVRCGVVLTVSPTILTRGNRTVHIKWSGVPLPVSDLDFLAIYSPANSRRDKFIGYIFLNSSAGFQSGSGEIRIPLVNLRSDYSFRIFRWTADEISPTHHDHDQNPLPRFRHLLAESAPVSFADMGEPDQIHLSFTDRMDEMRVLFVTPDPGKRRVRYGRGEQQLVMSAETEARSYERKDMCDSPANSSTGWRDPGFVHDAVMTALEMGKRYYYQVGSDTNGWSAINSFVSRDRNANETIAYLFGDMGTHVPYRTYYRTQEESKSTVKWILRDMESLGDKPAFVSHIGDISYARGYSWIWDTFFNQIEPIASRIPYHVCIGNHEYDWPLQPWKPYWSLYGIYGKDGGGECGVPYSIRFRMPGNSIMPTGTGSPDTRNLYYSFDSGAVHFLYLSTETDFLPGSDQYAFIKHDLEAVNRAVTPFVVVQGHRPMYTSSNEQRDTPLREKMLQHLEPLFVQNNVTLALWGHVHRYERFCPVKYQKCHGVFSSFFYGGAPVHVVIGMGGQDWQPIWEPRPEHPDFPTFPQPERSMYRSGQFGYTKLIATREKLTLYYIGNHDGQVHDMVEIFSDFASASKFLNNSESKHMNSSIGGKAVWLVPQNSTVYFGAAGIFSAAVLFGYTLGLLTRRKTMFWQNKTWIPIKSEETETETEL